MMSRDEPAFAFLMEQGTGKSKVGIDTAAYLFEKDQIDACVVIAPSEGDLPTNWLEQIDRHLPKRIKHTAVCAGSNMRAGARGLFKRVIQGAPRAPQLGMVWVTVNIEAIRAGAKLFLEFLTLVRKYRCLVIIDESTRIKNPNAAQTKACMKLGANAVVRRIATGTPITNSPFDCYSQFGFLDPAILGFDSYTAFKAHYCQMLPPDNGLIRYTANKVTRNGVTKLEARIAEANRNGDAVLALELAKKKLKILSAFQIPERGPDGRVIYRNQDELARRIKPFSYRVLKKDCLDLPDKIYEKRYVDLTPAQRMIYDQVKSKIIAEFVADGRIVEMSVPLAITRILRLQQIIGNYYSPDPDPDNPKQPPKPIEKSSWNARTKTFTTGNPKLKVVLSCIEEAMPDAKVIIWARFRPEIAEIVNALSTIYGPDAVGQIHGGISKPERNKVRHRFQDLNDRMRFVVAQNRSGIGIDLFAARLMLYYSNSIPLEERLQSEDRGHRIGLRWSLTIIDIEARNTSDSTLIDSLRAKKEISDVILGDSPINWI